MLYSVGYEVGPIIFCFEGYFNISMFKEFCNIFGVWSCICEGRQDRFIFVLGGVFLHAVSVKGCG